MAIAVILIAAIAMFKELRSGQGADISNVGKVFYSDDDGVTWFLDDAFKGSPFDHKGKEADRAFVYRCGSKGRPFVAFLGQYSDDQRARWAMDTGNKVAAQSRVAAELPRKFKIPGGTWKTVAPGASYPAVRCPAGDSVALEVSPFDLDNGAN